MYLQREGRLINFTLIIVQQWPGVWDMGTPSLIESKNFSLAGERLWSRNLKGGSTGLDERLAERVFPIKLLLFSISKSQHTWKKIEEISKQGKGVALSS